MNEENLQVILAYLDKIAAKLNIGLHEVWPWFIKQQYVDAFLSLGFLLATIVVAAILLLVTIKLWRTDGKYSKKDYYYDNNGVRVDMKPEDKVCAYSIYHQGHESIWVWSNAACIVVVLFAGFLLYIHFFDIFNPEYGAFKDLLATIKPPLISK